MSSDALRLKLAAKPYLWAYIVGTALLLVCSVIWWFAVYLGSQHVFWSMIDTSLSTQSVVVRSQQGAGTGDSLEQVVHFDLGNVNQAHSLTTLKQGKTEVKTEIIGTRTTDYTRYLSIASDTKADTSKVKNVWSKTSDKGPAGTTVNGHQLFAQAVLGVGLPLGGVPVPIGALTTAQHTALYNLIRDEAVYKPDFSKVQKQRKNGHLLYTYNVNIQTVLYIGMMKDFAKDLGMSDLDAVDPNSFSSNPTLPVKLTVDAYAHQLVGVDFGAKGYTQNYESYGLPLKESLPTQTISVDELQKRLQAVGTQAQ